jgi:hypothetical protein
MMRQAHESFVEHKASRAGYGRVMLMVDQANAPSKQAAVVSLGEATGAARVDNKANLRKLADRPEDAQTTQKLRSLWRQKRTEMNEAEEEAKALKVRGAAARDVEKIEALVRPARLTADGFNQATLLIVNNAIFNQHAQGGWVALFAWFGRLHREQNGSMERTVSKGSSLMQQNHPKTSGQASHLRDKPIDQWRSLWLFLELAMKQDWYDDLKAAIAAVSPVATWRDLGDDGSTN